MYKRKSALYSSVLFLVLLFSSQLFAQSKGNVKGSVKDKATGEALIGTNVFLIGTGFGAASDIDGNFRLTNIPTGEYTLRASYIGYEVQNITINVEADKTLQLEIELGFSGGLETEDVVVTAQAKGQMSAINEQLSSKSIKNVVSAEKLQELPDANAAESVGRLPGVSVLRSGGEGNKVVVRGLSPKYNKVTIEGVSMSASGQDRSTDISMISPYSLDGIEVIKAATADHDADFIGGLINFKLREADPGWKFDLVSQGGYNNLKSTYSDYIINGSISNRFFDDKLGIYFQGNLEKRNRSANELSATYKVENSAVIGKNNPLFIQNLKLTDAIRERSRMGATLVLDYKINDGVIHFKNFFNSSGTNINRYNEIFNPINRRIHSYEALDEQYDLNTLSNILDYEQRFGSFKVEAKLSHSNAGSESPGNLRFLFNQIGALSANVQDDAIAPSEIYDFATINDASTTFDLASETFEKTIEQQFEVALNLQYDFSLTKQVNGNIKIGGKYRNKDRSFNKDAFGSDLFIGSSTPTNEAIRQAFPEFENLAKGQQIPFSLVSESFDHLNFLDGEYSMSRVADLELMRRVWDVLETTSNFGNYGFIENERTTNSFDYSGTEDYSAAYIMTDIKIGSHLTFIPGVRYEKNQTTYTGVTGVTNIAYAEQYYRFKDTTVTRNNDFLLPMIHLKYAPVDWFDVRLAYTQTLSRPNYNLIMPRKDIWADNVSWNNYRLKPERSENLDFYMSFHENYVGLFTIGVFKKTIKDMIFNLGRRTIIDPAEYGLGQEFRFNSIFTFANNEHNADVFGIELDWQTNFWYLPGFLKGLVFNINYTHISSEAKYPITKIVDITGDPLSFPRLYNNVDSSYTSQLIDQPDDIVNIQIGYDYEDFSARLSMLYQSKIFKKAEFWPEETQFADEYLRWDFTAKQKLPWYGIQLFLNFNNITSALDRDLVKGAKWDAKIQHYGMTVDFGLRIKM
ncbi:MAG: TonB-dependent receptor [Melioribacteraceae bacterium]